MMFQPDSTLLFVGDSITDCGRARPVGKGEGLGSGYVNMVNAFLQAKYHKDNITVLNTGISGNTIRDLKARWKTDVLDLSPDYLSIMIGINDVWRKFDRPNNPELAVGLEEYEATYRELLESVKNAGTVKKVILITPFLAEADKSNPMMALLEKYIAAVSQIAAENTDGNYRLIELQKIFDGYIRDGLAPQAIAGDKVHPTQVGSMIIAREFLKTCGETEI